MTLKKNTPEFLNGGGEMGELTRNKNWAESSMGPPEEWPQSLRTTLTILLNTRFPMFLWWGTDLTCFYNDAYRPSLGLEGKHPSILGMGAKEAWPEIWSEIGPMIDNVIGKGESIWHENQLIPINRNGQMEDVYWTFSYSPVKDDAGDIAGVLVVCSETTEAVKAVASLRDSEARFREIADLSPMWIWITDTEINIEYANRNILDFIGIEHYSEFTGQTWEKMVHPEDIEKVYEAFGKSVEKQSDLSLDFRVKKASTGIYEWFSVKGVPRMESGKMTGFIGTGMSIESQRAFTDKLRSEVAIRTSELAKSNTEFEKMNKELQSFAYISSHDLQEPLRKIQTFSSILRETEYDRLSDQGKNRFTRMQEAAKRMQTLINDLLAYSRIDTGKRKFETVKLNVLVDEAKKDLSEELLKNGAKVEVESQCDIEVVPFQFRQLLYNLMTNSLKYAKATEAPIIIIKGEIIDASDIDDESVIAGRKYAHISVIDNGIGFDNEYSEKIFEVFQRLHNKEEYRGTGIGLAIVKKIVQNHKGFIKARGKSGKGAIFEIFIPEIAEVSD